MKVKRLKELIHDLNDELEIFVRDTVNPCGNIDGIAQLEMGVYSSFGEITQCLIINTFNAKDLGEDYRDWSE